MSRSSIVVFIGNSTEVISFTGDPVRIDTLYTTSNYLMTFSVTASDFSGHVYLEASIMNSPSEEDWFPLPITPTTYIEYPKEGFYKTETSTRGYTINGRYTWVRARIDRDYLMGLLSPNPEALANFGQIDRILLNL